jgi:hypothetical protein
MTVPPMLTRNHRWNIHLYKWILQWQTACARKIPLTNNWLYPATLSIWFSAQVACLSRILIRHHFYDAISSPTFKLIWIRLEFWLSILWGKGNFSQPRKLMALVLRYEFEVVFVLISSPPLIVKSRVVICGAKLSNRTSVADLIVS